MPCYHPVRAYLSSQGGAISFVETKHTDIALEVPCRQCIGCRLARSQMWGVRCLHESKLHEVNSFVTVTYSDAYLPPFESLDYRHVQCFLKRLRREIFPKKVRFFCVGEYGGRFGRPHYHLLLFGYRPVDCEFFKQSHGYPLYTSKKLKSLWGLGEVWVGDVSFKSACYVARYCLKKVTGDLAESHYARVDPTTGELGRRIPEFARMSLKPGIGHEFARKYFPELLRSGSAVVDGREVGVPHYYDDMFKELDPDGFEAMKMTKVLRAYGARDDASDERLAVREEVATARATFKKRELQ